MEEGLQVVQWFYKGGLVMYLLLFCSILIVAVAVERFAFFRKSCARTRALLQQAETALRGGDWEAALRSASETGGIVGRILTAGLPYYNTAGAMQEIFEESTALEATNLRRNLSHLSTVVTMAPLLGLRGTVVGMIGSFRVLDTNGSNPVAISVGVGEALIATATGLCVAVLALAIHTYFSHRLDAIITDVENICSLAVRQARRRTA